MIYTLQGEYIELYKLIKLLDLVDTGGQAKVLIENLQVFRNDAVEIRKRAKIIRGDQIRIGDAIIDIV